MKLKTGVLLVQAPLFVALVIVGVTAGLGLARLADNGERILRDNHRSVIAAQRMNDAAWQLDRAVLFLLAGRPVSEVAATLTRQRSRFASELEVEQGNITEPGEREAADELQREWLAFDRDLSELLAAPPGERSSLYFAAAAPQFDRVRQLSGRILDINQDAMVDKSDRAREEAGTAMGLLIAVALAACASAWWASLTLGQRLVRPVTVLGSAAKRIGGGDFKARAQLVGAEELVQLSGDFNAMADKLEVYRRSSLGELLAAQHAAQAAIDSLPDAVLILGMGGGLVNANHAARALLGVDPERLDHPAGPLAGVEPALREAIEAARQHVISGKGGYAPRGLDEAIRVVRAEGERAFLPRATPVYADEGGMAGVAVVLQEVSRLLRFDQLKDDLVATVAHELRTPLTSLRMAIHLCAEESVGPLTEKQADLMFAAREDAERLQATVDELLDLSRIQAGKITLQPRSTSAESLVEAALTAHRSAARDRQVDLRSEIAPGLPPLSVDAERLQIVFANLIVNGLRHAPPATSVTVRALEGRDLVRFEVSDAGPGVPPEERNRVFEKYTRGPGESEPGSGLGLYIAREIVGAHGGRIGVDGREGQGATFWFELPVGTARLAT